jgi:hypothetical protein
VIFVTHNIIDQTKIILDKKQIFHAVLVFFMQLFLSAYAI